MKNEREFDIILFGATGFTGRLVARYLLEQYGTGDSLRWAIAGRNLEKLQEVSGELGEGGEAIPRVRADSTSASDMEDLATRTTVVCSTVGPYAKYGSALIRACAEHGTHRSR